MSAIKKKPLVIFDLDGTLLDSLQDISAACNSALTENGLPARSIPEYRTFVGWGMDNLIRKAMLPTVDEKLVQKIRSDYGELYIKVCQGGCTLFDGVAELLGALRKAGILTGVVSNKPDSQTDAVCKSSFGGLLDGWRGQQEGVPIKPDPAGIALLEQQLDAECIAYVGDSNVDIETGHNAGVPAIGVSWGIQPMEMLAAAGADKIAGSTRQLEKVLLDIAADRN